MALGERYQRSLTKTSHRRKKSSSDDKGIFGLYLSRHLYLPILLLIIGVGQPVFSYFLSSGTDSERSTIASYLKNKHLVMIRFTSGIRHLRLVLRVN